jgi:hypothetical protein
MCQEMRERVECGNFVVKSAEKEIYLRGRNCRINGLITVYMKNGGEKHTKIYPLAEIYKLQGRLHKDSHNLEPSASFGVGNYTGGELVFPLHTWPESYIYDYKASKDKYNESC